MGHSLPRFPSDLTPSSQSEHTGLLCTNHRALTRLIRRKRGFSLVEVLIAATVVAVLLSLVLTASSAAFSYMRKTRELAAARTLIRTYLNVAVDDSGQLMMLADQRFAQYEKDEVNPRWTSRLKDYLGEQYRDTLYVNRQSEVYDEVLRTDPYLLTLYTTFGLNAQFVGGTSPSSSDAIRSITHAENPSKLIVFTSAANEQLTNSAFEYGFFRIEAPQISGWGKNSSNDIHINSNAEFDIRGYVAFRHSEEAVVAYLDGRVELANIDTLRDMRYWSNQALIESNPNYRPGIRH